MPCWKLAEEKRLIEMFKTQNLQDLANALSRSPKAVAKKLKRMHLTVPEKPHFEREKIQELRRHLFILDMPEKEPIELVAEGPDKREP